MAVMLSECRTTRSTITITYLCYHKKKPSLEPVIFFFLNCPFFSINKIYSNNKEEQTNLGLRDAALVGASKLSFGARFVSAALFIRVIATVVFVVAFPRFEDTTAVAASVLDRTACVERAVSYNNHKVDRSDHFQVMDGRNLLLGFLYS